MFRSLKDCFIFIFLENIPVFSGPTSSDLNSGLKSLGRLVLSSVLLSHHNFPNTGFLSELAQRCPRDKFLCSNSKTNKKYNLPTVVRHTLRQQERDGWSAHPVSPAHIVLRHGSPFCLLDSTLSTPISYLCSTWNSTGQWLSCPSVSVRAEF